ncbi:MAG TPA: hypothetical protein VGN82_01025 [Bosea sp. (in: a-proteobacteria)]|uniref:hypothetical protein n=1 Tax=Bosea sp. (in: a-proteobacteria) TaxID=1871050 RepID=UPI002E117E22|nr:hypothetical protein [Bosea sp. (in: a-proteobacteria)]
MKIALIAALALSLTAAGCVTAQEQRALDAEKCQGYGFRARTDAFAQCLQAIDLNRAANLRAWAYRDFGPYGGYGYYGYRGW